MKCFLQNKKHSWMCIAKKVVETCKETIAGESSTYKWREGNKLYKSSITELQKGEKYGAMEVLSRERRFLLFGCALL